MKKLLSLKIMLALAAAFLFAGIAFGSVKAEAATSSAKVASEAAISNKIQWFYDYKTDVLTIKAINTSDADNPAKIGIFIPKTVDASEAERNVNLKSVAMYASTAYATVSGKAITLGKKGDKIQSDTWKAIGESKDTALIITGVKDQYEKISYQDGTTFIKIDKADAEIKAIVFDYASAASGSATSSGLYSVAYKSNKDKTIKDAADITEYAGQTTACKVFEGVATGGAFSCLEWTIDKPDATTRNWQAASAFTGDELAKYINKTAKTKQKVYFRVSGKDLGSSSSFVTTFTDSGKRASKEKAMVVAIAKKAPKIKLEVKNVSFIKLKNGMDYQVVASGASINEANWMTVLPYKKGKGTATYPVMLTSGWKAVKYSEKDTNSAQYYTTEKVSKIAITELKTDNTTKITLASGSTIEIYYRTSAKTSGPASASNKIVLDAPAAKPDNSNEAVFKYNVSGEAIKLKFASSNKVEYAIIAKDDLDQTAVDSGVVSDPSTLAATKTAGDIDFTTLKWTKATSEKEILKPTSKVSTYKLYSGEGTAYKPKEAAKEVAVGDYLLIRYAGVSDKTTTKLPSEIAVFKITKTAKKQGSAVPAEIEIQALPATP